MMPSENTEKFDKAPPVNKSSIVIEMPPVFAALVSVNAVANWWNGIPGTGK